MSAAVGAVAISAFGSVVTGTWFQPGSAGAAGVVAGATGAPPPASGEEPQLAAAVPTPALAAPQPVTGGPSLESRDHAATYPEPPALATLSGYQWPLAKGRITLPFGPSKWGSRIVRGEPFHDGLDLATFCGDRIVAAHDGVVLAAGRRYDTQMGWVGDLTPYLDRLEAKSLWTTLPIVIVVDDGNGYRSIYAHLSKTVVKKGDVIEAGQLIGYEGQTGRASGCHLHYGLFSPLETDRFGIDPGVLERMKLPAWQTARVDPLLVLPELRTAVSEPRAWPSYEGTTGKEPLAD